MSGEAEAVVENAGTDEGFDAGFSGAAQTPTPAPAPTPAEAPAAAPAPADPPKLAQITEEQWNSVVTRANAWDQFQADVKSRFDNAFGQVGGLKTALEQLRTQSGEPVAITEDDLKEFADEFPELAPAQQKLLTKVLGKVKQGTATPADATAVQELVNKAVEANRQERFDEALDEIVDGDWKAEVNTPAYAAWIEKQSDDIKALGNSSKLRDAKKLVGSFWKSRQAPAPGPKPPAAPSPRQKQLAAAVDPQSAGGHPSGPTDEDAFDAGFKGR